MALNKNSILAIAVILTIAPFVSGCTDTSIEQAQDTTITVSAAVSLAEAFTAMEKEFEAENPSIDLMFNFASSGMLRSQIEGGAPIDVFASAAQDQMDMLAAKGLIYDDTREDFVENSIVLIVPKGNKFGITGMEDLRKPEVKTIAIGNPETVPAGKYAKESMTTAEIWDNVSGKMLMGENVKQVLVYVERGETDAGFVFSTDALTAQAGTIEVITSVPVSTPITYPIAVVSSTTHLEESQKFVDFITGENGRIILEQYGFSIPNNG
ncbi:molybdate ABC transporter substrate-binding protein [Methanolobus halotolerans]|uniref:Molybdate ABC transporter substrate-binding protein n=1 Tax=Methanolobus halotolerans TaxID=2052935 RepID=A0A4E0PSW2_9EURY|nr:molybdate ABC transporter substrate-binding protein [Methanolobus halotolerans]TGC07308.1 molybdate ABC transporter substrate-binding protein [Methanolobus halotolerans]